MTLRVQDKKIDPQYPSLNQSDPYKTTRFVLECNSDINGDFSIVTDKLAESIEYNLVLNNDPLICDTILGREMHFSGEFNERYMKK